MKLFLFQSRAWPRLHEASGRDGCHLGGRRGLMGSRRAPVHLVFHGHDKRVPRCADLRGGWLPAPSPGRFEEDLQQEPENERGETGKRS